MKEIKKLIYRVYSIDFIRFCTVGASGFLINFALLTLLYQILDFPIFVSQLISSEIALFSNFIWHHNWTYKHREKDPKSLKRYIVEFHMTSWVAIVGSSILVSFLVAVVKIDYILALAVSSIIALIWNFIWTRYFIWNKQTKKPSDEE